MEDMHTVQHSYQERLLVPIAAISDNIEFLCKRDKDTLLEFSDNVKSKVRLARPIHALSEEFDALLQDIYGRRKEQELANFLRKWYKRLECKFYSLEFIYIETDVAETEELPK